MHRALKLVVLALLGIVLSFAAHAQGTWSPVQSITVAGATNGRMFYQYLLLNYTGTGTKSPVLVYEHENSEGDKCYPNNPGACAQLTAPLSSGGSGVQDWFNTAAFQARYCANGCIIVSPAADQTSDPSGQTSNFGGYGDSPGSDPNERAVMAIIHLILTNFNADPNRVYVTGDSLGGLGSAAACLDYGINTGSVEKLVVGCMPFAGAINRGGLTNAQTAQVQGGPFVFIVNGINDNQSSNPVNWSNPLWTAITGNTNYPAAPVGGRAGSSPYYYLLDRSLGHDVWDTYRPLPAGQPMLDLLFAQTGTGGGGGLTGTPKSPLPSGYLHVAGNQIVDGSGNNVRISCNGYNEPTGTTQSAYTANLTVMRNQGFNCARYPWYDTDICPGGSCNFSNQFDPLVAAATATGMKIVFDHHGNEAAGCGGQQQNGIWYDVNGAAPWNALSQNVDGCGHNGSVTYNQFKANWVAIANHFKGNATVIGFDLNNEHFLGSSLVSPTVNWGGNNGTDVHLMCNDVGSAVQAANPGVLVICEGPINFSHSFLSGAAMPSGANGIMDLTKAQSVPVVLSGDTGSHVVYSIHDYPNDIGGGTPDSGPAKVAFMNQAWGFLVTQNFAPVWVGEEGASLDNTNGQQAAEQAWATTLTSYMNGQQGALGGPTFTGCQQPIGSDWWNFGNNAGQAPDGTLNPDGSDKAGQKAFWSTLLYTTCSGFPPPPPPPPAILAQRSGDFMNMLSIQGCLTGGGAPACLNASQQVADLQYLGISHYRTGTDITMSGSSLTALTALLNNGITLVTGTSYVTPVVIANLISQAHGFQGINANAIYALDGINEPELTTLNYGGVDGGDGHTWTPIGNIMKDWITAVLADNALKNLPIYGSSRPGAETNDVGLQFATVQDGHSVEPNGTVLAQFLNNHIYPTDQQFLQGGITGACQPNDPTAGNSFAIQMHWDNVHTFNGGFSGYASDAAAQAIPHVATEFGYPIASPGPSPNGDRVTDDKRGRCIMNGLLVGWQFGEKLISIYSMYDTIFGMFTASGVPSTSGTYVHNMTSVLADTDPTARNFTPGSLSYSLTGMPTSAQSQLFQKANGHFQLVVWNNVTNWNMAAGTPITISPTTVTLTLGGGAIGTMSRFDPVLGSAAQATVSANSITMPLADYPQIIDITAAPLNVGSTAWNPGDVTAGIALSGSNFVATVGTAGQQSVRTTTSQSAGKACFEVTATTIGPNWDVGLSNQSFALTTGGGLGATSTGIGFDPNSTGASQGIFFNNAVLSSGASTSVNGEIATMCADFSAGLFWASDRVMRAAGNPWNNSASANPATGTGGLSFAGMTCPCFVTFNTGDGSGVATLNATGPFAITTPAGFSPWQAPVSSTTSKPIVLILGAIDDAMQRYANDNAFAELMDLAQ